MAITTFAQLQQAIATGRTLQIYRSSISTQISGSFSSLWRGSGGVYPAQGAVPTAFATCTNALAGALPLPTITSEKLYVARIELTGSIISNWWLVDRLVHMGGLSGTITTEQVTNSTTGMTLTTAYNAGRCAVDGSDVDWFLEWYTATGSTAVSAGSFKYYNQSDVLTTATTAVAIPASTGASRMIQLIPNAGDTIKNVYSVTITTTGTAGNFGVTGLKRLFGFCVPIANTTVIIDALGTGLPEPKSSSCLTLIQMPSATSTGTLIGNITIVAG